MKRLVALFALLAVVAATVPLTPRDRARDADACAFAMPPLTYEGLEDRSLYMAAMDLAGYDMLFPGDAFFSQPALDIGTRQNRRPGDVYIPPTLLKAISWVESLTTQGAPSVPFGSIGPVLVSFDCGHGIAQVTSGMTAPIGEGGLPTDEQALVATHYAYNIGRGAAILADKWNSAPEARPIVGIDTDSDPRLVENWYYAVWSYNGFTGPGANRSNHPMDPIYGGWPRTPYSCGPASDGFSHNRAKHPYQELIYGCMARPPQVQGRPLWQPLDATLPDLNNPYWRNPLELANFQYPYDKMDLPTPKPEHTDPTARPTVLHRLAVLGFPSMSIERNVALVTVRPGQSATPAEITISNPGTGIVTWRASANKPWVTFSPQTGIAVGHDLPCNSNSPCERNARLTISVDPSQIASTDAAIITIRGVGHGGGHREVALFVRVNVALGAPGIRRD